MHDGGETLAFLAEQAAHRHTHAVEMQRRRIRHPPAHLFQRRLRESWRAPLDQQQRNPAAAAPARAHRHRVVVRPHARRDKHLGAIDDIAIAIALGRGADRRHVGAAVRLGDGKRADLLTRQDFRHYAFAQRVRAQADDRRRADSVAAQAGAQPARAAARQLLRGDDAVEQIAWYAAVFFRIAEAVQPDRRRLDVQLARKRLGLVPRIHEGCNFLGHEPPHCLTERVVLLGIKRRPCKRIRHIVFPQSRLLVQNTYQASARSLLTIWPAMMVRASVSILSMPRDHCSTPDTGVSARTIANAR